MRLADTTWTEVRDADIAAGLLPVGSTEQHGPHAPLGTDSLAAATVAEEAAQRYGSDGRQLLVTPTVPVGVAEEHRGFDGTLWVSPDAFRRYVRETAESLAAHGIDPLLFVNGHGGNSDALAEVAARLSRDETATTVAFTWFDSVGEYSSEMGHGGKLETAMIRHCSAESIREDRIEVAWRGGSDQWGNWVAGVNIAHDSDEFTTNGVVGDPREGSAELGQELLERAVTGLLDVLEAVEGRANGT